MLGVKVELQEHKIISDKHIIKFIDALSSMGYDTLVLDSNLVSKECMQSTSTYCELKGINFFGGGGTEETITH